MKPAIFWQLVNTKVSTGLVCNCNQQLHENNIKQKDNSFWSVFIHFILKGPDEWLSAISFANTQTMC